MASTFLNISTDTTLGGNSPSDAVVSSQKAIKTKIDTKQDKLVSGTNIKTVGGTSLLGSGNVSLPTKTSDLTNDSGYLTSSDTVSTTEVTLATVATSGSYTDLINTPSLSGYQTTANLVTSVSSSSTDSQYPSAKLFYDTCGDIETLINAL